MNPIPAFAWMVSLMVAPHTLALLGNVAGALQGYFALWVAGAAALYWVNVRSLAEYTGGGLKRSSSATGLTVQGLALTSRWLTTIMLSTVLLVTAGFAFNETFLYWFPNFAFAFILLGALVIVHLLGRKAARVIQVILVAIVLAGMGVLLAMGLWQMIADQSGVTAGVTAGVTTDWIAPHSSTLALTVLLFVGFDLALDHGLKKQAPQTQNLMRWGIAAMAAVLGLWGWVSLQAVPAGKLSDSFIPHIIAARSIGGEAGRWIMGAMVIAGSAAAVSALLSSISRTALLKVEHRSSRRPSWLNLVDRPSVRVVIAAVAIGWMMASGMAGEAIIDSYVRAGLAVWIFYYAAVHFSLLADRQPSERRTPGTWAKWIRPAIGSTSMMAAGIALMLLAQDRAEMLKLVIAVLFPITLVLWAKMRWKANTSTKGIRTTTDNVG